MEYIYILVPFVFAVMAISIPQILIREDHPKLERNIVIIRRIGYCLVAIIIIYGAIRYFT